MADNDLSERFEKMSIAANDASEKYARLASMRASRSRPMRQAHEREHRKPLIISKIGPKAPTARHLSIGGISPTSGMPTPPRSART